MCELLGRFITIAEPLAHGVLDPRKTNPCSPPHGSHSLDLRSWRGSQPRPTLGLVWVEVPPDLLEARKTVENQTFFQTIAPGRQLRSILAPSCLQDPTWIDLQSIWVPKLVEQKMTQNHPQSIKNLCSDKFEKTSTSKLENMFSQTIGATQDLQQLTFRSHATPLFGNQHCSLRPRVGTKTNSKNHPKICKRS